MDNQPDEQGREKIIERLLINHREAVGTFELQLNDGRWILVNESQTNSGETVCLGSDITELKDREEKLRQSEQLFSNAFHRSPAVLAITDPATGRHLDVNENWELAFGYKRDEIVNTTSVQMDIWVDIKQRNEFLRRMEEEGAVYGMEMQFKTGTGGTCDLLASGEFIIIDQQKRLLFAGQDITKSKELDRLKSEFISTVSHELRTPLTSIKGSLGIIASGLTGELPDAAKPLLDIANKNSERLVILINDILDIEKIEAGHMKFRLEPLQIGTTVNKAIDAIAGYAEEFNVTFDLIANAPDCQVLGEENRLLQVLANLMSNAAKFSPEGGTIEVAVRVADGKVRVSVADQGPGVAPEFEHRMFEKFAQADSSDTRAKGGTGLGLSISKAIIEQHNGSIGFDTELGRGSIFYFDLPILV